MHNNTNKSAIVTHDNSTMLFPRCNAHFLPVNNIQPRRVKMKTTISQQPPSRNTGDHSTTKYTTFNMERLHTQEYQPVVSFARENPHPCKLAPYGISRDLSQQYPVIQPSETHRQQEHPTPACFLTKKHQSGTITEWKEQNYGQNKHMPGNATMQQPRFLCDALPMVNPGRPMQITAPKAKGQTPRISTPTPEHTLHNTASLVPEAGKIANINAQKQQGSTPSTDRNMKQMEIGTFVGPATKAFQKLIDLLEASTQDDIIDDILAQMHRDKYLHERTGDLQELNHLSTPPYRTPLNNRLGTTKPNDTLYDDEFPPLQVSPTTPTPPSAQSPPTVAKEIPAPYAPPLTYQIHFHETPQNLFDAASVCHNSMARQHHPTSPAHNGHQKLSLLARDNANHHAYMLALAREATTLATGTQQTGGKVTENNDPKRSDDSIDLSMTATPKAAEHNPNTKKKTKETSAPIETAITTNSKGRPRWILIQLLNDHPVKANGTHFNKWAVITTMDKNYPQILRDIQAYEVFERQEPTSRIKKAAPRPVKTCTQAVSRETFEATIMETATNDKKDKPNAPELITGNSRREQFNEEAKRAPLDGTRAETASFKQSEMEPLESAIKTSLEELATTNEEHRMLELAMKASIQELGTPVTLDDTLNSAYPTIRITNIENSCYITNAVMALAGTGEGQTRISSIDIDQYGFGSELIRTIQTEMLRPIRSTLTQNSLHKKLHIQGEAIQNIRKKCQEIGWTTDNGQQCISDFLGFLLEPFGIIRHRTEIIEKTPNRPDVYSEESMGPLHLGLPQVETNGDDVARPIELTQLIQKAFLPTVDGRNVTTTKHMQNLSDTLIVHLERAHAVPGEDLPQRSTRRVDFPEQLPIKHLFPNTEGTKEGGQLKLTAVICHKGGKNIASGHFFTMLRTKVPGSTAEIWVKLDDLCPKSIEVVKDKDWLQNESIQSGAHIWIYEQDRQVPTNDTDSPTDELSSTRKNVEERSLSPNNVAQLFIKYPSGTTGVIKIPIQSTIKTLERASAHLTGIPTKEFHLVYGAKTLESTNDLPYYGITSESTIFVRLRCKGGRPTFEGVKNEAEAPHSTTIRPAQTNMLGQKITLEHLVVEEDLLEYLTTNIGWDRLLTLARVNRNCRSLTYPSRSYQREKLSDLLQNHKFFFLWKSATLNHKIWTMSIMSYRQNTMTELTRINHHAPLALAALPETMPADLHDIVDLALSSPHGTEGGATCHSMRMATTATLAQIMGGEDKSLWGDLPPRRSPFAQISWIPYPTGKSTDHPRGGDQAIRDVLKAPLVPEQMAHQLHLAKGITGRIYRGIIQGASAELKTKAMVLLIALSEVLRVHQMRLDQIIRELSPRRSGSEDIQIRYRKQALWTMLKEPVQPSLTADQQRVMRWLEKHNSPTSMAGWFSPWRREGATIIELIIKNPTEWQSPLKGLYRIQNHIMVHDEKALQGAGQQATTILRDTYRLRMPFAAAVDSDEELQMVSKLILEVLTTEQERIATKLRRQLRRRTRQQTQLQIQEALPLPGTMPEEALPAYTSRPESPTPTPSETNTEIYGMGTERQSTEVIGSILAHIPWDNSPMLAMINHEWRLSVRSMHHGRQLKPTRWLALLRSLYTWRGHAVDSKIMRSLPPAAKPNKDGSIPSHRTEKGVYTIESKSLSKTPRIHNRIQVFIKDPGGKTGVIEISSQATISTLKRASSLLMNIPTTEFYMIFGAKLLGKHKTLPHYGITDMSLVLMRLRCKGGGPSWMRAASTNPAALAAYLETKRSTQGNVRDLWKDEDASAQDAVEPEGNKTSENIGLDTAELTRRIFDQSLESMIQPSGVGGYGGIYPQSRTIKSGEDFTAILQWNVLTPCPAKGCLVQPLSLTAGIPTLREATHVYDWKTTLRAVQKNLHRDQPIPTFHDDGPTHKLLWSIATIHHKLEDEHSFSQCGCSRHLMQSWAEGGDVHPPLLESTKLLHDGWIRECTTRTHSSPFYEFILPAWGREAITNGVRFMVYGPWTTLEDACHAREWLAMLVFAGRSQGKHIFPICITLPNEVLSFPSLFNTEAQATFRMIFHAHRRTIRPTHMHRPPSAEIFQDTNDPNSFPSRCLSRENGIMIGSEAARRMYYHSFFVQHSDTLRLYNGAYRHEETQRLAGLQSHKRRKRNVVTLAYSTKHNISLALQTLILITKDWAFAMMADGTGRFQRTAYVPDQTTLTVSSSPLKYLLLRNLEQLKGIRAGETDEIYRTFIRDLHSFLSPHTPWAPHSEIPQTRISAMGHQESNSDDDLFISLRPERRNREEQPVIIVHKANFLHSVVGSDYLPEDEDGLSNDWNSHGRERVDHLHDDHGSSDRHMDTRRRTLHLAQHSWRRGQDVAFSSTILYIRILATASKTSSFPQQCGISELGLMHLERSHHSGENEGTEGLVCLTVSHQQSLWRLVAKVANSAKITTSISAGEVRASTSHSNIRVILHLQIGRGSSDTSQRDLEEANTELSDDQNSYTQVGQLKFLTFHTQGATIYLTRKGVAPPTLDPPWDLGWTVPDRRRETATTSERNNKKIQKMNKLLKITRYEPDACHHCGRVVEVPWTRRGPPADTPPYPSSYVCPLRSLLLRMLDRFGLQEIAYLFDTIHTLSELCNVVKLSPSRGPDLPISLDQQTRLWLLVHNLHSSFPQYRAALTQQTTSPTRNMAPMELSPLWHRTISRTILPAERWTTAEVAIRLLRHDLGQASQMALRQNINGQTLTELLYTFEDNTSRLSRPTGNGGLGLSRDAVFQIQADLQGFTRIHGFVHYSIFAPRTRRLEAYHTVQLRIVTGQGLGVPGILGPEAIGTFYQQIDIEEPVQALRKILSIRQDLGLAADDGHLIHRHQDNGIAHFLQNDQTLQSYGITEGSEIFLRQFVGETESPTILFEKENVRYETGAFIQFRPTEGRPTFGLILGTQEDQVRVRWVHEQNDIQTTLLWGLIEEYRVQLHDRELFLSNKLSIQPITAVLRKATVLLIDYRHEIPEPKAAQFYIRFHHHIPAPHPSTWTVDEVSENVRTLGCPAAAADILAENCVNGAVLTSADFDQYWDMDASRGGVGLTTTQARQLKTELEQLITTTETCSHAANEGRTQLFKPVLEEWLDRDDKPQGSPDRTDGTRQHETMPTPSLSREDTAQSEISPDTYEKDDFVSFLTPSGDSAIGKILSPRNKYTTEVQWMGEKHEVNKMYLNFLERIHGVYLLTNEIFYTTHRRLTIPWGNVIRKIQVWQAGHRDGKWFADTDAFTMDITKDYVIRFGTHTMDLNMSFVPLTLTNETLDPRDEIALQTSTSGLRKKDSAAPEEGDLDEPHASNEAPNTDGDVPPGQDTGTEGPLIQIRLRRPEGTTWEVKIRANATAIELYIEAERVTGFKQDLLYLESNGRRIHELDTLHQHSISQNSNVLIILRSRGGGDHVAGSKKTKNHQDNTNRAFEEAAKNMRMDKAQKKEDAAKGPQGLMDMEQLLARRDQLLVEGEKKERERITATRAEHGRHSKEDAVQKDILQTLATNENLSPEGEEELRTAINHTHNTLRAQRAPLQFMNPTLLKWMMNKHLQRITLGTDRTEKMMQTWLMNPAARESITAILRTRTENLLDHGSSCPSEIAISAVFGPHSRRSRVITLPKDTLQDKNRRQGTDFQVDMEMVKHGITELTKDNVLTVQNWSFDMIIDPPETERLILVPTHQDNNQVKLLAFITGIRGFRDSGNEDTKIELIMFQSLKDEWDKKNPTVPLSAVRVEYSRRVMSKNGTHWVKPRISALGVKAIEAPRFFMYLGHKDPSQTKEELKRAVKEALRTNSTISLNMVADTDTSSDHTITFGLRPFNDKPETGTKQAIDRAKDRLQTEQQIVVDTIQKIDGILQELRSDRWGGSTKDASNIIRSLCGDLIDDDRPASSQTLGTTILDTLGDNEDPATLDNDETWRENIPQQRLVITVVTGITNFHAFFAMNEFKQRISTHQNKHTAQMFHLRKALQKRQVETETVEFIFEERRTSQPQNDTFIAVFTEQLWTRLIQPSAEGIPAILTPIPNTMARKLRSTDIKDVLTLDGSLKSLPGLTLKAVEEIEMEDDEDEPTILSLLSSGHPIFMPQCTDGGEEIHAGTALKDITDPKWAALRIHNLDLKHPDKILTYLHSLQERKRAQRLSVQRDVIVWMHPPLVDILLAVGHEDFLKDLRTQNCKDTNHQLIMGTLKEGIQRALLQHADKGLWLQDTPFMDAIPGTASQDGIATPFPANTSELEAPAVMPGNIGMLLRAPTTNKCQLLLDLTTQSIQGLVEQDLIVPIQKRGHTLLLKTGTDILPAVLRSDKLRVGWPINFDTLEVSNEETAGALQQLISQVFQKRGWGIVRLSVPDMADHPNFDSSDYEPTQQLTNPFHISNSGSQILYLGRWIIDSPALKQLKLAKGILIFTTPHPKGILWICPGKETPGHKEYRSLARLLGKGEETDRQVHARVQETLLTEFDSDTSLLAALDKERMDILLKSIRPLVEGSPAILQDHFFIKQDSTEQETFVQRQQIHRPQILAHWNLQSRWTASSDTGELTFALLTAKSQGLLGDRYDLSTLDVPQIGTLILKKTDQVLMAKFPPVALLSRTVAALQGPLTTMEDLTGQEAEDANRNRNEGAEGPLLPE